MSLDQFKILKAGIESQPALRNEFELAFAAIASKHHPSDRAERFVFGGTCEWLLAITAWKAGVKALPAGHGQNGFDLMQFRDAMQGLWSLKSSASPVSSGSINLRNNASSTTKATGAVYDHPTVFMGPYLPGITYVDFKVATGMANAIVYDKDAAKLKTKAVLDYATAHPELVIPVKLSAIKTVSDIDSNLKIVANVLESGTYPLLKPTVELLQNYALEIKYLRKQHAEGIITDENFQKKLLEMELQ